MIFFKKQKGFTLIELVVVIVLLGVLSLMAVKLLSAGLNSFLAAQNVTDADWQGRIAMARMSRDIHMVRSNNDITTATASNFTFVNTAGTTIAYTLSGTTLKLNSDILANGVNSLTFSYYDKNGNVTATIANMEYVGINLNITQDNTDYSLITSIYLRDLTT